MDPTLVLVHSACPRSNPAAAFRDVCIFLEPMWCFTYPHTGYDGGLVPKLCLTLATPRTIACLLHPWDFPGKNTGVDCISFSSGSSQPRNRTWVSFTAGEFFTDWATRKYLILPVYVLLICRFFWWDRLICFVLFSEWYHLEPMILQLFCFFFIQWCIWESCHRGAYMSTSFFFTVT